MAQDTGFQDPSGEVLAAAATTFGLLSSAARLHIVWALAEGRATSAGSPSGSAGRSRPSAST